MISLIENVLSLERQADDLVTSAQQQAKAVEKETEPKLESVRKELASATEQRIGAFRAQAEARHRQDTEKAEQDFRNALKNLESISPQRIQELADQVAARFRGV